MAEDGKLLSEEEMDAIGELVSSGALEGEGYNVGLDFKAMDLLAEDTTGQGINMRSLEQISELFHRNFRTGMLDTLRYNARFEAGSVSFMNYAQYLEGLPQTASVTLFSMPPFRNDVLCLIHPQVIFSCLDNWFGGSARSLTIVEGARAFTATEKAVIDQIRKTVFAALTEAWSPFLQINCELRSHEENPQFANIAGDSDFVVVNRFETVGDGENLGFVDLVYLYTDLKLERDALRRRLQVIDPNSKADQDWTRDMSDSMDEVPFNLDVKAGELPISLQQLRNLKVGDVIPFRVPDNAEVSVNGFPVFKADIGSVGKQAAVKISETIMAGVDDE
tara:strand:- start:2730 stop:3731 length:1002 start_codon:yes stop_codon:yes gene_type:complete